MPTLAPPVLDTGGTGSAARQPSARKPLTIVLVFVATLVVTVVALRLILGPFGGDDDGSTSAAPSSTTVAAATEPPPSTVPRPADAQETPDGLARQFVLEFLTRTPGESPAQVGERLHDLLSPEYAYGFASQTSATDEPGSLVEVGPASPIDPDIFEVDVSIWTYAPGAPPTEAVPAEPQVWRVAVREYLGLWTVTAAQAV
jgi:hypothetical protein